MKCFFNPNGQQIVSLENVSNIQVDSHRKNILIRYVQKFENCCGEVNTVSTNSEEELERFMKMIFKILSEDEKK